MGKNSSGDGPKGNGGSRGNSGGGSKGNSNGGSKGNSGGSKGSSGGSNKGSSSNNNKGSSGSNKGSGGNSGGLGNVGWGGGSKGPNLGGGSYHSSTGFGKGDTGSSFGNFNGSGKGSGSGGGGNGGNTKPSSTANNQSAFKDFQGLNSPKPTNTPKQATQATSSMDAAFKNFKQDTVHNTQLMQGTLYTREDEGGWKNTKTGQSIEGKHIDRQAYFDGLKQDNIRNKGRDELTAIKDFFADINPFGDEKKETGPSPLGGWASYGGAVPGTEDTRSMFTKIGDAFTKFGWGMEDAPLHTIASLATNPMVTTAASFMGGLPAIAAIKGASVLNDAVTGVTTTLETAQEMAKTAIGYTPVGAALGEFKGMATAAVSGFDKVPGAIGGFVGGKVGVGLGESIGQALSNNPFSGAIGSMVGGTVGSIAMNKITSAAAGAPSGNGPAPKGHQGSNGNDKKSSPLVSKGDTLVASAAPQAPEADPMKYIREMQLPFYGPNYQYNPYGFPNTMMGA